VTSLRSEKPADDGPSNRLRKLAHFGGRGFLSIIPSRRVQSHAAIVAPNMRCVLALLAEAAVNYGTRLLPLWNGAPADRLLHLAQYLHDLGPRSVLGFFESHAEFPPHVMRALGGYELEPPVLDISWVIRLPTAETVPRAEEL
jgi:hypothetical protein